MVLGIVLKAEFSQWFAGETAKHHDLANVQVSEDSTWTFAAFLRFSKGRCELLPSLAGSSVIDTLRD